jgi:hypothetical protein
MMVSILLPERIAEHTVVAVQQPTCALLSHSFLVGREHGCMSRRKSVNASQVIQADDGLLHTAVLEVYARQEVT